MEKNNKGFILAESLIVSTFVLGTLVFLYVQFSNVNKKYDTSFRYNTIEGLYATNHMKTYLMASGYNNMVQYLTTNHLPYIDFTSCSTEYVTENSHCQNLVNVLQIKQILFTKENFTDLKNNITNDSNLSEGMKNFIQATASSLEEERYRLWVEFQDNTYASIKIFR